MNIDRKVIWHLVTVQIISAIVWAAVIITCSWTLKGADGDGLVSNILLAGATTHFLLLSSTYGVMVRNKKDNKPELA